MIEVICFVLFFCLFSFFIFISMCYIVKILLDEKVLHRKKGWLKEQIQKQKYRKLRKKYNCCICIVEKIVSKNLNELDKKIKEKYNVKSIVDYTYLSLFEEKLYLVRKMQGKDVIIDSYIIATCLMFSILEKPRIFFGNKKKKIPTKLKVINFKVSVECALDIISSSVTYIKDDKGNYTKKKNAKVNLSFPNDMYDVICLYKFIMNYINKNGGTHNCYSILEFSKLLKDKYLCEK